jgi:glycine/D-amino acid oxidase-like deaminating enzyme
MVRTTPTRQRDRADVLVIGDGIIGLSTALAIARSGSSCHIIGNSGDGQASSASAGLLAPSLGATEPWFREFMRLSRDRYPDWLRWLAERTGIDVTLNRLGIVEIEFGSNQSPLRDSPGACALDAAELRSLEPALTASDRGVLHPDDGYVDNVTLLRALREALRCEWSTDFAIGRAASIVPSRDGCAVRTEDGRALHGRYAILAAGAWSPLVAGLPRHVNVEPVRGQMLLLDDCPLGRAVSSPAAYLVPRGGGTLVGSTLERVGFENRTTAAALQHLQDAAISVVPSLARASVARSWAGLRPLTPDGFPILGRDPEVPSLFYACGHGKNGVLLAPITAECVASLIAGSPLPFDLTLMSIERFG